MAYEFITCEYAGGVVTLTLNRPPHNVLSIEMMEEMNSALLESRDHPELKVLLIRGSGDVFSLGVDPQDHTRERVARMATVFHRIFETMRLLEVIAVAAVNGSAVGGGFELAIGCNLILASDVTTFRLPQVSQGTFPLLASVILPRAIARRKAMEWILTGEEVRAEELERFGLVNRVFDASTFDQRVDEFVTGLASNSGPVLQLARRAQVESYYCTYEEALYKVEHLYLRDLLSLADSQEGTQAMLEGRAPKWRDA